MNGCARAGNCGFESMLSERDEASYETKPVRQVRIHNHICILLFMHSWFRNSPHHATVIRYHVIHRSSSSYFSLIVTSFELDL